MLEQLTCAAVALVSVFHTLQRLRRLPKELKACRQDQQSQQDKFIFQSDPLSKRGDLTTGSKTPFKLFYAQVVLHQLGPYFAEHSITKNLKEHGSLLCLGGFCVAFFTGGALINVLQAMRDSVFSWLLVSLLAREAITQQVTKAVQGANMLADGGDSNRHDTLSKGTGKEVACIFTTLAAFGWIGGALQSGGQDLHQNGYGQDHSVSWNRFTLSLFLSGLHLVYMVAQAGLSEHLRQVEHACGQNMINQLVGQLFEGQGGPDQASGHAILKVSDEAERIELLKYSDSFCAILEKAPSTAGENGAASAAMKLSSPPKATNTTEEQHLTASLHALVEDGKTNEAQVDFNDPYSVSESNKSEPSTFPELLFDAILEEMHTSNHDINQESSPVLLQRVFVRSINLVPSQIRRSQSPLLHTPNIEKVRVEVTVTCLSKKSKMYLLKLTKHEHAKLPKATVDANQSLLPVTSTWGRTPTFYSERAPNKLPSTIKFNLSSGLAGGARSKAKPSKKVSFDSLNDQLMRNRHRNPLVGSSKNMSYLNVNCHALNNPSIIEQSPVKREKKKKRADRSKSDQIVQFENTLAHQSSAASSTIQTAFPLRKRRKQIDRSQSESAIEHNREDQVAMVKEVGAGASLLSVPSPLCVKVPQSKRINKSTSLRRQMRRVESEGLAAGACQVSVVNCEVQSAAQPDSHRGPSQQQQQSMIKISNNLKKLGQSIDVQGHSSTDKHATTKSELSSTAAVMEIDQTPAIEHMDVPSLSQSYNAGSRVNHSICTSIEEMEAGDNQSHKTPRETNTEDSTLKGPQTLRPVRKRPESTRSMQVIVTTKTPQHEISVKPFYNIRVRAKKSKNRRFKQSLLSVDQPCGRDASVASVSGVLNGTVTRTRQSNLFLEPKRRSSEEAASITKKSSQTSFNNVKNQQLFVWKVIHDLRHPASAIHESLESMLRNEKKTLSRAKAFFTKKWRYKKSIRLQKALREAKLVIHGQAHASASSHRSPQARRGVNTLSRRGAVSTQNLLDLKLIPTTKITSSWGAAGSKPASLVPPDSSLLMDSQSSENINHSSMLSSDEDFASSMFSARPKVYSRRNSSSNSEVDERRGSPLLKLRLANTSPISESRNYSSRSFSQGFPRQRDSTANFDKQDYLKLKRDLTLLKFDFWNAPITSFEGQAPKPKRQSRTKMNFRRIARANSSKLMLGGACRHGQDMSGEGAVAARHTKSGSLSLTYHKGVNQADLRTNPEQSLVQKQRSMMQQIEEHKQDPNNPNEQYKNGQLHYMEGLVDMSNLVYSSADSVSSDGDAASIGNVDPWKKTSGVLQKVSNQSITGPVQIIDARGERHSTTSVPMATSNQSSPIFHSPHKEQRPGLAQMNTLYSSLVKRKSHLMAKTSSSNALLSSAGSLGAHTIRRQSSRSLMKKPSLKTRSASSLILHQASNNATGIGSTNNLNNSTFVNQSQRAGDRIAETMLVLIQERKKLIKLVREGYQKTQRLKKLVSSMVGQASMSMTLLKDLMNQAQLKTNTFKMENEYFDLIKLLRRAIKMVKNQARDRKVTVEGPILPEESSQAVYFRRIYGDMRRYLQIGINFLSNAIKFTRPAGKVSILLNIKSVVPIEESAPAFLHNNPSQRSAKSNSSSLNIKIVDGAVEHENSFSSDAISGGGNNNRSLDLSLNADNNIGKSDSKTQLPRMTKAKVKFDLIFRDTGVGIAKADLERIFKNFSKVDKSHKLNKQGVGLGLSICREIIMAHGGNILVESEEGRGTDFIIELTSECQYDPSGRNNISQSESSGATSNSEDDDGGRSSNSSSISMKEEMLPTELSRVTEEDLLSGQHETGSIRLPIMHSNNSSLLGSNLLDPVRPMSSDMLQTYSFSNFQSSQQKSMMLKQIVDQIGLGPAPLIDNSKAAISVHNASLPNQVMRKSLQSRDPSHPSHSNSQSQSRSKVQQSLSQSQQSGPLRRKSETSVKTRCLLANDNSFLLQHFKLNLEGYRIKVDTAEDGLEACKKVKQMPAWHYNFIILDINMPTMGGVEACKIMKAYFRKASSKVKQTHYPCGASKTDQSSFADNSNTDLSMSSFVSDQLSVSDASSSASDSLNSGSIKDKNGRDKAEQDSANGPMIYALTAEVDPTTQITCKQAGFAAIFEMLTEDAIQIMMTQAGLKFGPKSVQAHDSGSFGSSVYRDETFSDQEISVIEEEEKKEEEDPPVSPTRKHYKPKVIESTRGGRSSQPDLHHSQSSFTEVALLYDQQNESMPPGKLQSSDMALKVQAEILFRDGSIQQQSYQVPEFPDSLRPATDQNQVISSIQQISDQSPDDDTLQSRQLLEDGLDRNLSINLLQAVKKSHQSGPQQQSQDLMPRSLRREQIRQALAFSTDSQPQRRQPLQEPPVAMEVVDGGGRSRHQSNPIIVRQSSLNEESKSEPEQFVAPRRSGLSDVLESSQESNSNSSQSQSQSVRQRSGQRRDFGVDIER